MSIWLQNGGLIRKKEIPRDGPVKGGAPVFSGPCYCRKDKKRKGNPHRRLLLSHIWAREPFDPESLADAAGAARALLPFRSYALLAAIRLEQSAPHRDGATPQVQRPC